MALTLTLGPGWERYQRILRDPQFVGKPRSELLRRAANAGLGAARKQLKNRGMHGHHHINAYDSLRYDLDMNRGTVVVRSLMPYYRTQSIEHGEPPGIKPPVTRIARGILKRPNLSPKRLSQLTDEELLRVFRAVRDIEQAGQPAMHMFANTERHWRDNLTRYLEDVGRKMEAQWARAA